MFYLVIGPNNLVRRDGFEPFAARSEKLDAITVVRFRQTMFLAEMCAAVATLIRDVGLGATLCTIRHEH